MNEPGPVPSPAWSLAQARDTYNIAHWGSGYFDINEAGHVIARPDPAAAHPGIDLHRLAGEFDRHGLKLPVLVRFSGILHHRIDTLIGAFARAAAASNFRGCYTSVYPIKVNQQSSVVEAMLEHGGEQFGLEAGSKPELLAVLARSRPGGLVVCNGYKDREFIRLALRGRQLGLRVHIVIEKLTELEWVLEESAALGVEPLLGIRVRLASIGTGKWQNTGGDKSKFGLKATEALAAVERLRDARRLDCLAMLHCHMGSQIANIRDIQAGMHEVARYYAELHRLGARVRTINVGGGLGVDYEGTRSRSFCSINYSVDEYALNIVRALSEVCAAQNLPHPDLVSESGRALTAHHALLVTNVIDVEPAPGLQPPAAVVENEHPVLRDLWHHLRTLPDRPVLEVYHDAVHRLGEAQSLFAAGVLNLRERARAENLYFAICQQVRGRLQPGTRSHRELLDELNERLADKVFCNFSLFQSIPDHWAIDQIFPVLPLSRLDEPPTRRGVLQDITCDSDGRMDLYVDSEGVETTLPLHALREGEPYRLGIFLVGAYQEILGDMHNLFGDTDSVQVESTPDGGFRLTQIHRGDTVDAVLRYVHFDPEALIVSYRERVEAATGLDADERETILSELRAGLEGYTYLED